MYVEYLKLPPLAGQPRAADPGRQGAHRQVHARPLGPQLRRQLQEPHVRHEHLIHRAQSGREQETRRPRLHRPATTMFINWVLAQI